MSSDLLNVDFKKQIDEQSLISKFQDDLVKFSKIFQIQHKYNGNKSLERLRLYFDNVNRFPSDEDAIIYFLISEYLEISLTKFLCIRYPYYSPTKITFKRDRIRMFSFPWLFPYIQNINQNETKFIEIFQFVQKNIISLEKSLRLKIINTLFHLDKNVLKILLLKLEFKLIYYFVILVQSDYFVEFTFDNGCKQDILCVGGIDL